MLTCCIIDVKILVSGYWAGASLARLQLPYQITEGLVNMAEMVRVNTRISKKLNDWLDEQTEETGLPKSTQIMMAIEMYQQQKMAKGQLNDLAILIEKMEQLAEKVKD